MGFLSIIALAVGAGTAIMQQQQARRAARAQREARAVSSASQTIQDTVARRRAAREARIRRAMVEQGAVNTGTAGSSGELGAQSALQANLGSSIANQTSQARAAEGISAANQEAAEAEARYNQIGAYGKLFQQGIGIFEDAMKARA